MAKFDELVLGWSVRPHKSLEQMLGDGFEVWIQGLVCVEYRIMFEYLKVAGFPRMRRKTKNPKRCRPLLPMNQFD